MHIDLENLFSHGSIEVCLVYIYYLYAPFSLQVIRISSINYKVLVKNKSRSDSYIVLNYQACAMLAFKADICIRIHTYTVYSYTTFSSPDDHAGTFNNFVHTQILSERT